MEKSDRTIADWFNRGTQAFKQPDGVAAVKAFQKVIDLDPAYRHSDGDNAYFYLGKIFEIEGDLEKAVVMYSRAIAIDSRDEESLIGRGSCYTVLNRHEEAISDFKKVIGLDPRFRRVQLSQIYYVIAENYRKKEVWDKAWKWGQMAKAEDPNSSRIAQLVDEATSQMEK